MKNILFTLVLLLFSNNVFAHEDAMLGEGIAHFIYHGIFWIILIALVIKIASKYFAKKNDKHDVK